MIRSAYLVQSLAFTQNLDFLDGFMSNFGITANYTYLKMHKPVRSTTARFDSTGAFVGNTNVLDQLSLSPHSFNVIPYYETDKFGVRLAGNFRSHLLTADHLVVSSVLTVSLDDRMQWDLSGSYNINDQLSVGAEVINMFNTDPL